MSGPLEVGRIYRWKGNVSKDWHGHTFKCEEIKDRQIWISFLSAPKKWRGTLNQKRRYYGVNSFNFELAEGIQQDGRRVLS